MTTQPSYVYLLQSTSGNTYIGATVDLDRRLRQHNKEIKGGARATGAKVARGETWTRVAHVFGFPDWQAALQFEWRWKNLSRTKARMVAFRKPLERRMAALRVLLDLPQSTSKATPYAEWPEPPRVHLETEYAQQMFANQFKDNLASLTSSDEPQPEPIQV
jgi:structure-specific endonuclease subunit SLX1